MKILILMLKGGTVFKIGNNKVVYLFKYEGNYYGVDLLMYKIRPKLLKIYDIGEREVIEILSTEKFLKIIDFLSTKNVILLKEINKLYDKLRLVVYK